MTQLITASELEDLNEFELRSKFWRIASELAKSEAAAAEVPLQRASLETIEQALTRKRIAPKRWPGPRLG
jgi:hypothetical protein